MIWLSLIRSSTLIVCLIEKLFVGPEQVSSCRRHEIFIVLAFPPCLLRSFGAQLHL